MQKEKWSTVGAEDEAEDTPAALAALAGITASLSCQQNHHSAGSRAAPPGTSLQPHNAAAGASATSAPLQRGSDYMYRPPRPQPRPQRSDTDQAFRAHTRPRPEEAATAVTSQQPLSAADQVTSLFSKQLASSANHILYRLGFAQFSEGFVCRSLWSTPDLSLVTCHACMLM